jgi:hypothetical protein
MKRLVVVAGLSASCLFRGEPTWHATAAQMAPLPPLDPHVTSKFGPLALEPGAAQPSWPDIGVARQITEDHYLDRARIHEEATTFVKFVDTFFQPLTPETKIGFEQVHQSMATLENLAPYSVYSVTLAYQQSSERLHLCILNAGVMGSCTREHAGTALVRVPEPISPAFEIGEAASGIARLAIHDLRDADDPAWRGFASATRALAKARGIVIDLRGAVGSDPRAVLPWIAELTGGGPIKPLRAIERPDAAAEYVAAYRARFADRGRDPTIWSALVGEGSGPRRVRPKQPIALIVGHQCESACELVARVLETYAGAIVIGGVVSPAGRLARDEPAMFVLPHSQTSVYFHATRYLLAADIEAATGPTEEWHAIGGDGVDDPATRPKPPYPVMDFTAFAIRDITQRLAHPDGWPRCDSLPVPATPADTAKLHGLTYLANGRVCPVGYQIMIESEVPGTALGRFLSTCTPRAELSGYVPGLYSLRSPQKPTAALLSQIAASELVKTVTVDCQPEYHPN